ncbi:HNH endonuclease [Streptomyces chartreusis]|uniref:HNH endonuclease n=1 Tax=Streptomyces chartreusis TaxID=1969 RepID=UPI0035DBD6A1
MTDTTVAGARTAPAGGRLPLSLDHGLAERLATRSVVEGECWRWTGATNKGGYGVIGRTGNGNGAALTHKAAYEFYIADVPAGLDLDHRCRNRWCWNPWHLDPVTRKVNVARGLRAPGYGPRERPLCPYGHQYDGKRVRPDGGAHRVCETCHRAHTRGVSA